MASSLAGPATRKASTSGMPLQGKRGQELSTIAAARTREDGKGSDWRLYRFCPSAALNNTRNDVKNGGEWDCQGPLGTARVGILGRARQEGGGLQFLHNPHPFDEFWPHGAGDGSRWDRGGQEKRCCARAKTEMSQAKWYRPAPTCGFSDEAEMDEVMPLRRRSVVKPREEVREDAPPLQELPKDIVFDVLSFLTVKETLEVATVNRKLYAAARSDRVWARCYQKRRVTRGMPGARKDKQRGWGGGAGIIPP